MLEPKCLITKYIAKTKNMPVDDGARRHKALKIVHPAFRHPGRQPVAYVRLAATLNTNVLEICSKIQLKGM